MHQPGAQRLRLFGQHFGCQRVDEAGLVGIAFGFVYRRISSGVDDDLRTQLSDRCSQRVQLGKVTTIFSVQRDQLTRPRQRRQRTLKHPADLAVFAEEQDTHCYSAHSWTAKPGTRKNSLALLVTKTESSAKA